MKLRVLLCQSCSRWHFLRLTWAPLLLILSWLMYLIGSCALLLLLPWVYPCSLPRSWKLLLGMSPSMVLHMDYLSESGTFRPLKIVTSTCPKEKGYALASVCLASDSVQLFSTTLSSNWSIQRTSKSINQQKDTLWRWLKIYPSPWGSYRLFTSLPDCSVHSSYCHPNKQRIPKITHCSANRVGQNQQ